MTPKQRAEAVALVALGLALWACSGQPASSNSAAAPTPAAVSAAPASSPAPQPVPAVDGGGARNTDAKRDYSDGEFFENDRSRDPFRSFIGTTVTTDLKPVQKNQRVVTLSQYALEELKLIAIVTGGDGARAMMVDPTGKGWVLKRGEFVGRPEVVHIGGASGSDYQVNWRVDKVREGEVVFLREDPAQPAVPPATRVVPLRADVSDGLSLADDTRRAR